jgi:hypothetical protein
MAADNFNMIEDDLQPAESKLSVDSRTTLPPAPSAHLRTKPSSDPFPSEWLEIPQAFDRRKRPAQAA